METVVSFSTNLADTGDKSVVPVKTPTFFNTGSQYKIQLNNGLYLDFGLHLFNICLTFFHTSTANIVFAMLQPLNHPLSPYLFLRSF